MANFLLDLWNSESAKEKQKNDERMSLKITIKDNPALWDLNEFFNKFLTHFSWIIYMIGGTLVICCIWYYFYDCKRRMDLHRRRIEVQRANERLPQRRRPGAAYRDHQIFRNVMTTVRQYTNNPDEPHPTPKRILLRRTQSGVVYGRIENSIN